MSHESRVFFVECLSPETYNFLVTNIEPALDETKMLVGAKVEVRSGGQPMFVEKHLILIEETGIQKLRNNKGRLGLRFNLFMRESRGAKITPWKL